MIDLLARHSGLVMLLVFSGVFVGIAAWVFWPGKKERFARYAEIPLKEVD